MYNHQKKPSKNPQLGKRDMAPKVGGSPQKNFFSKFWVMTAISDSKNTIFNIKCPGRCTQWLLIQ